MRIKLIFYIVLIVTGSCKNATQDKAYSLHEKNVSITNDFIDAFYSFNGDSLELILSHAPESSTNILYYQKWAECGNYEIIERSGCIIKNDSQLICPIKVKDDLIGALVSVSKQW